MVDGEAHRSGGSPVVEAQDSGLSFRDADPGGEFQLAFGRRSSFLGQGSIPAPDDHIAGHAGAGGRIEYRHEAGTCQPGGAAFCGIDGRVGQDAVCAGRGRHRNPERTSAAALQQADLGGTGRSFLGNELYIGNGAGVREQTVFIQAGQGTPDGIAGQVGAPVGGNEYALRGRRHGQGSGEGQGGQD